MTDDKRPIPNWPGYFASSTGEITHTTLNAPVPQLQTDGTISVRLVNGTRQQFGPRAKLVLSAFGFEPTEDHPYIVHINGNLTEDQLANLDLAAEPERTRLTPVGVRYGYGTGKVIEEIDTSPSGGDDGPDEFTFPKSKPERKFK